MNFRFSVNPSEHPFKLLANPTRTRVGRLRLSLVRICGIAAAFFASAVLIRAAGEQPSRNENTKADLFYYVEGYVSDINLSAKVKGEESWGRWESTYMGGGSAYAEYRRRRSNSTYYPVLASGSATPENRWLKSSLTQTNAALVNQVYRTHKIHGENIEKYRLHYIVPDGFEVLARPAGTYGSFRPQSVFESTAFGQEEYEIVVVNVDEPGALAGKITTADAASGEFRFALGFLSNGKAAGFLDFVPDLSYRFQTGNSNAVTALANRNVHPADFRCISASDEVEVITYPIPATPTDASVTWRLTVDSETYYPAKNAVRQVVTPQAIVDISTDGVSVWVRYYPPSAKGARVGQDGQSSGYPAGHGPYTLSGEPFVTYLLESNVSSSVNAGFTELDVTVSLAVSRTEGANEKSFSLTVVDHYTTIPPNSEIDPETGLESTSSPSYVDFDYPRVRNLAVEGFGSSFSSSIIDRQGTYHEPALPSDFYSPAPSYTSAVVTRSSAAKSGRFIYGAGSSADLVRYDGVWQLEYYGGGAGSPPPSHVYDGDQGLVTQFSYYGSSNRVKWRSNADRSWQMFEYSSSPDSGARVTKIVSPFGDTEMPSELPSGGGAAGLRITTHAYAQDWEGVPRVPSEVIETADNQRVGHTKCTYASGTANGQPVWITKRWVYPSNTADGNDSLALYSVSKSYEGRLSDGTPVASWLRGLPYSAEAPDGSKESVAYHRGTYNATTKTFTKSDTGLGFRSVVLRGSGRSESGGAQLTSYDGTTIDSIYMIPNVSTAEVTIRDNRAFSVRSETLLYTSSGWILIDSSDMQYDVAGNLIRRQKLNGALYEAEYTNLNGTSETFSGIAFANSGTRTGQREYDRDEQGVITKFYYDAKGRVSKTVRLAVPVSTAAPDGAPSLPTSYTYDDENRVLSTSIGATNPIVSSTTYDKSGRVTFETNQGLTTSYDYTVSGGLLTKTTITLPGGATRIIENYRDGRLKSVTGTAGIAEYYSYAVESNQEKVTKYLGANNGSRWAKTYTDWAGRNVKQVASSTGGDLVQISAYNVSGQLSSTQSGSLAPTIYFYDGNGVMNEYGLDLDSNGSLGASDQRHKYSYDYRQDGGVWSRYGGDTKTWWEYAETFAFPDGATTGQTLTRTWKRITGFDRVSRPPGVTGVAISEAVAADVHGNRAVTQIFVDRTSGTTTTVVYAPFAVQPSISVAAAGRPVSQKSAAGVTISYKYDALDRVLKTVDRTTGSFAGDNIAYYSGTTRIQSITDNRNVRQHYYTYDDAGRVASDQTPRIGSSGGTSGYNTSYFAYNERGQLTHVWGDVPYPVKYEYDAASGDRTAQYTYRNTGFNWAQANLAASGWPASGDKTTFVTYPSNGLLNKKIDAANREVVYTYNAQGRLLTRTWSRAATTSYSYFEDAGEATGALKKVVYSDGTPTVEYTYDRMGRLKTVRDGTGDRMFTYRSVDQKPEAELFGRFGAQTTNHVLGTNRQLGYQYDPTTGRFIGVDIGQNGVAEHAISYGFDRTNGRLNAISTGAGVFRYKYLANSNLISEMARGQFKQARTYKSNRNVLDTLMSDAQSGRVAGYDYTVDDLGRRMSVDLTGAVHASYVAVGEIMRTTYGYNERNELGSASTAVGSANLEGRAFAYEFDPIGNRTEEKPGGSEFAYATNQLNQYTGRATPAYVPVSGSANRSGGAGVSINGAALPAGAWKNNYFYTYLGRTVPNTASYQAITLSATSGSVQQTETVYSMLRATNETFSYDLDGNLTGDSLWVYAYDGENRLKSLHSVLADQSGYRVAVFFAYDYMGRRVSKEVWSYSGTPSAPSLVSRRSKTFFAYQGWTLLAEYVGDLGTGAISALARRFTFGIDLSGTLGGAGDIGGLLAIEDLRTASAGTYLAASDGNGNVSALVEAGSGAVVAAYEYDPFGNPLQTSGRYGRENPFRFAGKYFDQETGLSYYGFRYYTASLGRFVNRDPLEERGGWTLYSGLNYTAANPFAGASGVEGPSWTTAWEQAQDRLLANTSLPHSNQAITFDRKNSGLPGSLEGGQKTYSANATGHYAQGGAPGSGPLKPVVSVQHPGTANSDINLYIYCGNNAVNAYDALGLATWGERWDNFRSNVATVAELVGDFSVGVMGGVAEANSPVSLNIQPYSTANDIGVRTGHLLGMVQSTIEMNTGLGMIGGSGALEVVSVGASTPVSIPLAAGGAAVTTHGAAVGVNSLNLIKQDMQRPVRANASSNVASENPAKPITDKPSYTNPGHHQPGHPNFRGGGPEKTSVIPENAEEIYKNAIPDEKGKAWYSMDEKGNIHQFRNGNDGTAHWAGSSDQGKGVKPPPEVMRRFNNPNLFRRAPTARY